MPRSANAPIAAQMMPGILRATGSGRQQHRVGTTVERLVDGELVVAHHLGLGAELAEVLDEVVDEAVVAVDHQDAGHGHSLAAPPTPCRTR